MAKCSTWNTADATLLKYHWSRRPAARKALSQAIKEKRHDETCNVGGTLRSPCRRDHLGSLLTAAREQAKAASPSYRLPPSGQDQWYWEIGGGKLPATTGAYPAPGSANIWDTDDFEDANSMGSNDEPNGPSSIVSSLHASGKYSICYIEAGAQQDEPDASHFAPADYGNSAEQYEMQGWAGEYWFDTRGFAGYHYGDSNSVLTGAAPNIAAGMAQRIAGCTAEGQDAIEPDDLDGYTNPGDTGVNGGGWGLTQQDAQGYEAWLAFTAHTAWTGDLSEERHRQHRRRRADLRRCDHRGVQRLQRSVLRVAAISDGRQAGTQRRVHGGR